MQVQQDLEAESTAVTCPAQAQGGHLHRATRIRSDPGPRRLSHVSPIPLLLLLLPAPTTASPPAQPNAYAALLRPVWMKLQLALQRPPPPPPPAQRQRNLRVHPQPQPRARPGFSNPSPKPFLRALAPAPYSCHRARRAIRS
jgi:hypothetical protein